MKNPKNHLFAFASVIVLSALLLVGACKKDNNNTDNPPQIIVQPDSPLTDVDGNVYTTVKIGRQVWMAENLRVINYRLGGTILPVQSPVNWTTNTTQAAYCYYDNQPDSAEVYGALYNGKAVTSASQLAPAGWRIPTAADITQLRLYLDSFNLDEGCLKEAGVAHWLSPNTGGTNSALFNALPSGYRFVNGNFTGKGYQGQWWLNDGTSSFLLKYDEAQMQTANGSSMYGYAVRCIKE